MFYFLLFLVIFVVIYLIFYYIFDDALKKEKDGTIKELSILQEKFDLDPSLVNKRSLLKGVSIINGFIIAITTIVVDIIGYDNIISYVVALVMIVALIFGCYFIYGKLLHKKWGKDKNEGI